MTMPDPATAGLDPAHVLAVCTHATGGKRGLGVRVPDGLIVCMPSRRTARTARKALIRVGYRVTAAAGENYRDLIVTGWSPAGLDARLAAMRAAFLQLADDPEVTARAVLTRFGELPPHGQTPASARDLLEEAGRSLSAWISAHSGIHAVHDPAIQPADIGTALRLQAAWALEQSLDALAARHLHIAAQALAVRLPRPSRSAGSVIEFPAAVARATTATEHRPQPARRAPAARSLRPPRS
jgi:hypothetical protein